MPFVSKLLTLPFETLEFTLLHTEPRALASLSQSCRSLHYFIHHAHNERFWRLYFLQYFDDLTKPSHDLSSITPGFWRMEFCKRWSINGLLGYYHDDPEGDLQSITSMFQCLLDKAAPIHISVEPSKNIKFLKSCIEDPWFLLQPREWPLVNFRPTITFSNCCRYLQFLFGISNWAPKYHPYPSDRITFDSSTHCGNMVFTFFEFPRLNSSAPYAPPNWDHLRLARALTQIFARTGDTVLTGGYRVSDMDALRNFYVKPSCKDEFGVCGRWK